MTRGDTLSSDNEVKKKFRHNMHTGEGLKAGLYERFGTLRKAGDVGGLSEDRIHQICAGYKVPLNPDLIKKYAEAWHIDIVVLSTLFEKLRGEPPLNAIAENSTGESPAVPEIVNGLDYEKNGGEDD